MNKSILTTILATALGASGSAQAVAWTGELCLFDQGNGTMSDSTWGTVCDQATFGQISGTAPGTATLATSQTFFNNLWFAHDIVTYSAGTYSVDTTPLDLADNATSMYTFTVGAGQVGAHMLFDWSANFDIDVINVWDLSGPEGAPGTTYTSTDWDGDGIFGGQMIDGPFSGVSANFNMTVSAVPVPAAVWLFGSGLIGLVSMARRKA